ncbi:MAG: MYG1 family protein [bacterium]
MKQNKNKKLLVTHNGSFHADDIFACATLSLMLEKKGNKFKVIRTRDEELVKRGDYVFDVGGIYDPKKNRFDHHQKGGGGIRENGIEYSSFGLVWKKFGKELCNTKEVMEIIDDHLVAPIDAFDNGFDLVENKHKISPYFIEHFFFAMRPALREKKANNEEMFLESVRIAKEILSREIIHIEDAVISEKKVNLIYKKTKDKRILVLNEHFHDEDILNKFKESFFVIYPRGSDNLWGIRAIRENTKTFKNKKDFPKKWAGLRDEELQKVTGVKDAVFCHKGLFLTVAKSKEGAIKLAKLALKIGKSKISEPSPLES